jgi:hypothetical protein
MAGLGCFVILALPLVYLLGTGPLAYATLNFNLPEEYFVALYGFLDRLPSGSPLNQLLQNYVELWIGTPVICRH